jgi:hypothetical protein
MAQSKRTSASYLAESRNIKPLSTAMQQWVEANRSKLKSATAKQKEIFKKYDQMKKAGMLAAKPAAAKKPAAKPKDVKKGVSTTPAAKKPDNKRKVDQNPTSTSTNEERKPGTRGELRPNNPPSPTVRRKGSTTGATVDPRERSLRKNLQESKSRKGSTSKGRKNIAAQVKKASGSSKRNQKLVEARRRRAREEALKKNLREMFGSKYNN